LVLLLALLLQVLLLETRLLEVLLLLVTGLVRVLLLLELARLLALPWIGCLGRRRLGLLRRHVRI
jgi:hypothetical protein